VQADRTPLTINWHHDCDHEKGTCTLINVAVSGDRNTIKKEAEASLKYKELNNRNIMHVEHKKESDTRNDGDNWNHLKIVQQVLEQHIGNAQNQGCLCSITICTWVDSFEILITLVLSTFFSIM
jgi:hypothetical protein